MTQNTDHNNVLTIQLIPTINEISYINIRIHYDFRSKMFDKRNVQY